MDFISQRLEFKLNSQFILFSISLYTKKSFLNKVLGILNQSVRNLKKGIIDF